MENKIIRMFGSLMREHNSLEKNVVNHAHYKYPLI